MAKIQITGDAMVITSTIKMEALKLIEKYRPKALELKEKNEEGVNQTIFAICSDNTGSVNKNGVIFNGESRDEGKYATITLAIPQGVEDVKAYAVEKLGVAILYLNKLELLLPSVLEDIKAEQSKMMESIFVT